MIWIAYAALVAEKAELKRRIAKVREIAEGAEVKGSIGCFCRGNEHNPASELCWQPVAWSIDPAEILAVLDGVGEKATGGILKPGEAYVVGESGCSLPHMPLPKGGIPTGQKVTVHVSDPALREVIDKALDLGDSTEDAAYDKETK